MNTIYIRTLKKADHTVFCVADGQKYYYDQQFGRKVPFSSGQQVKRSLISTFCESINQIPSPVTFFVDITKQNEIKEGEAFGTCDPSHVDQLVSGWMKATKGGTERTIKRRSPLSVSAMRALHPLLAGLNEEAGSFDRSEMSNTIIVVRDENGVQLNDEEVQELLAGKNRSLGRKWLNPANRASGLFISDFAIDLRRLFCISLNSFEPEVSFATIEKLTNEGWIESENVFGPCLVAPKVVRDKCIKGLAKAIIDWRITSNQSRTFSLMETFALSISNNANAIAGSIRAKLSEDDSKKAIPVIDEKIKGADTFVTLQAAGYVQTRGIESYDALEKAEQQLIDMMMSFDYENQL